MEPDEIIKKPDLADAAHHPQQNADDDEITLTGKTSPGVKRIEAISKHISRRDRWFLFFGVFLIAYVYGLDGTLRYTYQPYATGSYGAHSLLATLNVVRAVIAAAAQPTAAKVADVFGRVEVLVVSVVFYVVGTIIEAASNSLGTFAAGAIIYQIGYTAVLLLVEVIIGDITSTRSRLFFSYIPAAPFIINTWVSGNISSAVLNTTSWRWGIGMFAIIYPVCAVPLILALWLAHRRAKRSADLASYKSPYQMLGAKRLIVQLFWQLDVVGIFLLMAVLALILIPFTIAGGEAATPDNWRAARIVAPLVIGIVLIPCWILWESKCKHPMVPFKLLKDRAVWSCIGIAVMLNFAWYLQGDYLYTVLVVAFNESITTATRVTGFYSFFSVVMGIIVGGLVFFVRRLKPFIVFGTLLFMVAYGILIEFRGGSGSNAGVIGAQVLLGIAGGFFPYAAQASIQTATRHEHLAVVTGLYLASYNVGSALGNTLSGAIWTNILPNQLEAKLAPVTSNTTMASAVYGNPLEWIYEYPWNTPERDAVVQAYRHTQKLLTIAGICLCAPLIVFALLTRNPRLTDTQSIPGAEGVWSDSEAEEADKVAGSGQEQKSFMQKIRERVGR